MDAWRDRRRVDHRVPRPRPHGVEIEEPAVDHPLKDASVDALVGIQARCLDAIEPGTEAAQPDHLLRDGRSREVFEPIVMLVQAIAGRDRWMPPGELIEVFIDECRKGSGRHRPAGDAGDRECEEHGRAHLHGVGLYGSLDAGCRTWRGARCPRAAAGLVLSSCQAQATVHALERRGTPPASPVREVGVAAARVWQHEHAGAIDDVSAWTPSGPALARGAQRPIHGDADERDDGRTPPRDLAEQTCSAGHVLDRGTMVSMPGVARGTMFVMPKPHSGRRTSSTKVIGSGTRPGLVEQLPEPVRIAGKVMSGLAERIRD